jgi:hypothetical protein
MCSGGPLVTSSSTQRKYRFACAPQYPTTAISRRTLQLFATACNVPV